MKVINHDLLTLITFCRFFLLSNEHKRIEDLRPVGFMNNFIDSRVNSKKLVLCVIYTKTLLFPRMA